MSKFSPILFIIAGVVFYVTAFTASTSKAVYIALGTVFLVLGIAAYRRMPKSKQNKMQYTFYDFVGTVGTVVIIGTYLLLQFGKIKSETLTYSLLNAIGAGLILISLVYSFNFSAFIVEFFWLLISLFAIGRYFLRKNN